MGRGASAAAVQVTAEAAHQELARRELERRKARKDYAWFLDQCRGVVDEKTGERFKFHLTDESHPWHWQRGVLDTLASEQKTIILKARQIGITWVCAGYQLADALCRPGTRHIIYRQKEDDAAKIVNRIWDIFNALPSHLRMGVRVLRPQAGFRPTLHIEFEFPDGSLSSIVGMATTESAGHGDTVATALVDEAARIEKLRGIWTALNPAIGVKGKVFVVSTANGLSSGDGEGNYFHHLWTTSEEKGLSTVFLGWQVHPDRDQDWYDNSPEVKSLGARERAEQYPNSPEEAFRHSLEGFFDADALDDYAAARVMKPLRRYDFRYRSEGKATLVESATGKIHEYAKPDPTHSYAIGADVSTGTARDYSAAYVVDLSNMEIAAEFHGKIDPDLFAEQLHYLGRWYNTALVAVENQGGYGQPVIIGLRDGRSQRPPYPNLYRHIMSSRPNLDVAKPYGFPMNSQTRTLVLNQLQKAVRERALPWLTPRLFAECQTFIEIPPPGHSQKGPWPRAQDGAYDDCVMAAAIAVEMYRLKGKHPERDARRARRQRDLPRESLYPWQNAA